MGYLPNAFPFFGDLVEATEDDLLLCCRSSHSLPRVAIHFPTSCLAVLTCVVNPTHFNFQSSALG